MPMNSKNPDILSFRSLVKSKRDTFLRHPVESFVSCALLLDDGASVKYSENSTLFRQNYVIPRIQIRLQDL